MTTRPAPPNVGSQPRDVLQPALSPQTIAYHSTALPRLAETTELGLAAAGVLAPALGLRQGLEITLTSCIILTDHARSRLPTSLGGSSGSLFSRAINSLISIEGADAGAAEHASAREAAAAAAAAESAEACRVDEIVGDSKFLVRLRFFLMPATTMLRLPILYFCCACFVRALPPAACCAAFPADRSAVGSHNLQTG